MGGGNPLALVGGVLGNCLVISRGPLDTIGLLGKYQLNCGTLPDKGELGSDTISVGLLLSIWAINSAAF